MDTTADTRPPEQGQGAPSRWLDGTSGSIALVALLTGFILARLLGPIGLGEWVAIVSWPVVLVAPATLGLRSAMTARPELAVSALLPSLSCVALAAAALAGGAWLLLPTLLDGQTADVVETARWFLLQVPIVALFVVALAPLRVLGDQVAWDWFRSTLVVLFAAVVLIAVLDGLDSPSSVALGLLIVEGLAVPFVILASVLRLHAAGRARFAGLGTLLRRGFARLPALTLGAVTARLGQLVLVAAASPDEVGFFAGGALWAAITLPLVLWFDELVRLDSALDDAGADDLTLRRLRLSEAFGATVALVVLALAPLAPLVLGDRYAPTRSVAIVLAAAALARGAVGAQRRTLAVVTGPSAPVVVEAGGLVVGLGVSALLVGSRGAEGVALGVLAGAVTARSLTLLVTVGGGRTARDLLVADRRDARWLAGVWRSQTAAEDVTGRPRG